MLRNLLVDRHEPDRLREEVTRDALADRRERTPVESKPSNLLRNAFEHIHERELRLGGVALPSLAPRWLTSRSRTAMVDW